MKLLNSTMTDRERILTYLLRGAYNASVRAPIKGQSTEQWRYAEKGEPIDGQLVMAQTSPATHEYIVAWCVGRGDPGPKYNERDVPKIRAIGESNWIWFFNESFSIYNGDLTHPIFLEGWKYAYYQKLLRAMPKAGDAWRYKFGGLKVNGETAILIVRPHVWFSKEVHGEKGDDAFTITLPMAPKLSQRTLISELQAQGFGTKWEKIKSP